MPSLGLKKKENLSKMDSFTEQLPQLSNEMQLAIMNKVKNGEMSIEDALDEARKEQEHLLKEQSPTQYNFSVHKHSRYRWQKRVFQIDFKTKMLCSIEKGIVKRQLPFSMVKSCEAGVGSRFSISFKEHHDYELEAKSMEDKDKIMQLMNQIIYENIYSGPGDDGTEVHQQPEAPQSLREGVLLLHRGGLASLKWVKYQVQLHPGQLTLVPFRQQSLLDSDVTSSVSIVIHLSDGDTRVPKPQGFDIFTLLTHKNEYYFKVPLSNEGPGNVQKERDAWVQAIDKLCSEWKRKSRCEPVFEEKTSSKPVSIPEDPYDKGVDTESNGDLGVESVVRSPADSKTVDHTSNGKDSSSSGGASQNGPSADPKPVPKPRSPKTAAQDVGFDDKKSVQSPTSLSIKIPPSPSALPVSPPVLPLSPSSHPLSPSALPVSPPVLPLSPSALPVSPPALPLSPSALPLSPPALPLSPSALPLSPSALPLSPSALPLSPDHAVLIGPPLRQESQESGSLVVKEPPSSNIPAPPPLPFKVYSLKGKPSTKTFHWDLVGPEKIPKSFWVQGKTSKIEIDTLRLLEQFAVKVPGTIGAVEQSNTQHIMLNQKIAHNFNIFLKSFPVRPGELKDKLFIINEDDGGLSDEHITSLRRYVPTPDDVEMYKSHKGPVTELHIVDQYMMEMCNIPYLSMQLDLLLTLRELPTSMNDLQPLINQKIRLCQQLYNCGSFVSVLEYLLAIGNYLNENAGKEKAKGFRLSSLTKLSQLRGRDKNFTLLHALVEQIMLHQPGLAVFTEELAEFETVPGASIKGLTAEVDVLKNELQKVIQYGKTFKKKNIGAHHPNFSKDLKMATEKYNSELNSLMKTCEEMKKLYSVILVKFGEPADQESQKLCSIISQFILDFKRTQAELV